jgi:cell division protein FtsQ
MMRPQRPAGATDARRPADRGRHLPGARPADAEQPRSRRARRPVPDAGGQPREPGERGRHLRGSKPVAAARRPPEPATPAGRGRKAPAPPRIDPRIAARRAEVQAEAAEAMSRRRRRVAGFTVFAFLLVASGAAALFSPLSSVSTIQVIGAKRTPAAEVRAASRLAEGTPLVRVDEAETTARIAALPWVEDVRIERRWPRTVVVTVEERTPAAVAPCQAGTNATCLVDAGGRVLAPVSSDPKAAAGLPRLAGVPVAGPPGATVAEATQGPLAVAVALPEALRPLVAGVRGEGAEVALDLQAPGRTDSPPVVRLGGADRIPEKLTAAATVLARTSVNGLAVLDVRVPESPALTRVRR